MGKDFKMVNKKAKGLGKKILKGKQHATRPMRRYPNLMLSLITGNT